MSPQEIRAASVLAAATFLAPALDNYDETDIVPLAKKIEKYIFDGTEEDGDESPRETSSAEVGWGQDAAPRATALLSHGLPSTTSGEPAPQDGRKQQGIGFGGR